MLFDDEEETSEGIGAVDAQSYLLLVVGSRLDVLYGIVESIGALPSFYGRVLILVVNGIAVARHDGQCNGKHGEGCQLIPSHRCYVAFCVVLLLRRSDGACHLFGKVEASSFSFSLPCQSG